MSEYREKDAGKETGAGGKEVARAWHAARDDAAKEGGWGVPKNRHEEKDGCFVATAVYDDFDAPEVKILRKFRDELLLKSTIGQFFVRFYYKASPQIANFTKKHYFLKRIIKNSLDIFIRITK